MSEPELLEDYALRRMLWRLHGCRVDESRGSGEMSCLICSIDFKRMNPLLIDKLLKQRIREQPEAGREERRRQIKPKDDCAGG